MDGGEIRYAKLANYLGITLDWRLSFMDHMGDKCKKAVRLLMAAKTGIGKLW